MYNSQKMQISGILAKTSIFAFLSVFTILAILTIFPIFHSLHFDNLFLKKDAYLVEKLISIKIKNYRNRQKP
jgi:hypothetical protein